MSPQVTFFSRFFDVWCTGKIEIFDDLLPVDVSYHLPPFGDMDRESLKQFVAGVRQAFPDFAVTVDQERSEGDTNAARWRCTGTSPRWPVAPTGKNVSTSGGHFVA
jgi:ketosteroid isomerase-like protein